MDRINKNKTLIGCLCAFGCEVIFGLSYMFTKQATEISSELSLLGWRFFIAFIFISILCVLGVVKINFRNKKLKPILLVALFNPVLYFIGETFGIKYTTASESGVFLACIPVICVLMSAILLHNKPRKNQIIGIVTTLIGVLITVLAVGIEANFSIIGYLMLVLAVVSYALYSVFVEKNTGFTSVEITFIMLASGAIIFGILACAEGILNNNFVDIIKLPIESKEFLIAVIYQSVCCSLLAFFMSNIAITNIGVNRTSSFVGVSTVVSIIAGAFILKESFTFIQVIGVIFIIIGVYIANMNNKNIKSNENELER